MYGNTLSSGRRRRWVLGTFRVAGLVAIASTVTHNECDVAAGTFQWRAVADADRFPGRWSTACSFGIRGNASPIAPGGTR